jgi:hypothetical protein
MSLSKLRQKLDENSAIIGIAAILTITGVAGAFVLPGYFKKGPPPAPTKGYYYEVQTGNLVNGPLNQAPPIVEGKTTRVLAYVFSCGSCNEPGERFTGYLLRLTDAGKKSMEKAGMMQTVGFRPPPALPMDAPSVSNQTFGDQAKNGPETASQIKTPSGSPVPAMAKNSPQEVALPTYPEPLKWMGRNSKEAAAVMMKIKTQCDGKPPKSCWPD